MFWFTWEVHKGKNWDPERPGSAGRVGVSAGGLGTFWGYVTWAIWAKIIRAIVENITPAVGTSITPAVRVNILRAVKANITALIEGPCSLKKKQLSGMAVGLFASIEICYLRETS